MKKQEEFRTDINKSFASWGASRWDAAVLWFCFTERPSRWDVMPPLLINPVGICAR